MYLKATLDQASLHLNVIVKGNLKFIFQISVDKRTLELVLKNNTDYLVLHLAQDLSSSVRS